jgi:wyosine [tRNA(Phe)-imidazoG37] synthetase (radical SAM superfamily)
MQVNRSEFYPCEKIVEAVRAKIEKVMSADDRIDYLTFVPDGEPTLDINLGKEITMLGQLGMKVAVITNSSLLWREDVREELLNADWVSVKVDAMNEKTWRTIDRPHRSLDLDSILKGILEFSKSFSGELTTETMIVKDMNDDEEHFRETARYLSLVNPERSYLAIPTRPPAVHKVRSPDEEVINHAYQIFHEELKNVEYLTGYEGNAYARTGDVRQDILSITAVHPMREDAVKEFLHLSDSGWHVIEKLLSEERLIEIEYEGNRFYLRKFIHKP